jgi:DNA-directed RNA polymerase subunit M/transcription elongation factor TFIIS
MKPLIIKNGQFQKDGVVERPEIGKLEHIRTLEMFNALKGKKHTMRVKYWHMDQDSFKFQLLYKCPVCGTEGYIIYQISRRHWETKGVLPHRHLYECTHCGVYFKLEQVEDSINIKFQIA